jgi:peptidoglycan/xylan/chitin deacetylase (PgdA/CDA1 family)
MKSLTFLFVVGALLLCPGQAYCQATPSREIAITIDDLPAASPSMTAAETTAMTTKLLATLKMQNVPAIGFVNERKLYRKWGEVDERIKALSMWLEAGFDLGNHTYGHTSLNQAGLKDFEESVVRGETVTSLLLAEHGKKLRYFRHPYLDTGRDIETRREAEAFLVSRGYRIAPITMDAWDWNFAGVYDDAKKRGDSALEKEVASQYLKHHDEVFEYDEKLSKSLLGYEPKQIILLHANNLEADHIGELLDLLRKRGYKFITLDEALSDSAYSLPDTFVGEEGGSWIEHWAISRGIIPRGAPEFPQAIGDRAKVLHQPQP